jgi:hypothetical protein
MCKRCQNKKSKQIRLSKGSTEYQRDHLKSTYGITIEQYNELLTKQNGVCAICEQPETKTNHKTGQVYRLSVDHDHKTDRIRGLLCCNCNAGLAKLKEDKILIGEAINYLKNVRI